MATVYQTPTEILDYTFNWGNILVTGEVISTSSWAVSPSGLTINTPAASFTGSTTTVWITGGVSGTTYVVTNTIMTSGGRTFQESLNIIVQSINNF